MKQKIVVLGGGKSPEKEVSVRSASAVARAAREAGFEVSEFDPASGYDFLDDLSKESVVLPILHGAGGEDGQIQAELEKRGLRFLGADSEASRLCFDKSLTRKCLLENGLPMPAGHEVKREEYENHPLVKKPHILKVARGGSSIGTLFVRSPEDISPKEIDEIFKLDDLAILEELVEGVEITIPILGDSALPVIEIRPPENGEFDFENKYNGQTAELCPPENVLQEVQLSAQRMAERVHKSTGCRHLSRVDIFVRPDNSLVVLEINTIPGMTDQSLYPKSAKVAGISMPELIRRFVEMAQKEQA